MNSNSTTDSAGGDRSVSPVIGTVLLVSLTILLATVLTVFVLDIAEVDDPVEAAITLDDSSENATVTVQNARKLDELRLGDGDCTDFISGESTGSDPTVGDVYELADCQAGDRVVIVGKYGESDTILIDSRV